jgi:FAD/FMN-containing dehydrogenase
MIETLPDGSVLRRHSEVRSDNTGYDLASLFVGAEGTLGVITGLDLRLHPTPTQRITAIAGFDDLDALIDVGREFRDADGIATQQRLWQVREAVDDVLGIYGPPLKFDVSLSLSMIAQFATAAARLVGEHGPDAIPVLFGHIGEGNLHLNLARCVLDTETERALYSAMMALIAQCRGNVSSEHGVGTRKRDYLTMSRTGEHRRRARAEGGVRPGRVSEPCGALR